MVTMNKQEKAQYILSGGTIFWPLVSPNITPYDFCRWGYTEDRAHNTPVAAIDGLKQRIAAAIGGMTRACCSVSLILQIHLLLMIKVVKIILYTPYTYYVS